MAAARQPTPPAPSAAATDDYRLLLSPAFAAMSRITDNIFMTGVGGMTRENFARNHIDFVVNITTDAPLWPNVESIRIAVEDESSSNLFVIFNQVIDKMHESIVRRNAHVLVHCVAGVSRSATLVIGYLMKVRRMSLRQAFNHCYNQRPVIRPNNGFMAQLINYEQQLFNRVSVRMVEVDVDGTLVRVPNFFVDEHPHLVMLEVLRARDEHKRAAQTGQQVQQVATQAVNHPNPTQQTQLPLLSQQLDQQLHQQQELHHQLQMHLAPQLVSQMHPAQTMHLSSSVALSNDNHNQQVQMPPPPPPPTPPLLPPPPPPQLQLPSQSQSHHKLKSHKRTHMPQAQHPPVHTSHGNKSVRLMGLRAASRHQHGRAHHYGASATTADRPNVAANRPQSTLANQSLSNPAQSRVSIMLSKRPEVSVISRVGQQATSGVEPSDLSQSNATSTSKSASFVPPSFTQPPTGGSAGGGGGAPNQVSAKQLDTISKTRRSPTTPGTE